MRADKNILLEKGKLHFILDYNGFCKAGWFSNVLVFAWHSS
jgi:hypothetical protein